MSIKTIISTVFFLTVIACSSSFQVGDGVKTTFQSSALYQPNIDPKADAMMVYGVGPEDQNHPYALENRIKGWKDAGYTIHFMTGIAWGEYANYFNGSWDGKEHYDEGQMRQDGTIIWHGPGVPYIVPTDNYLTYFKETIIKRTIDAGIDEIFLEEPEFWAFGGYSESFKKEWKAYYGTEWQAQHESAEATYMSNKLKYHLYYRAFEDVFTFAKEYGKSLGRDIKCYIPTHSLVNYSQWSIVSPEASLASLDCVDGYIAQVWTGTSREPNFYNGKREERVFENAFLEYGCMRSMTDPTGRKLWLLTDPIEDWPRDWVDYRKNYHATFTAQLMYPEIANYEVMPWPARVYTGLYSVSKGCEVKSRIPADYATMMQVMINALQNMPVSDNKISGIQGINVLMGNSLMFQSHAQVDGYDDPQLSDFYGLALPLLKQGVPVGITHIENTGYKKALDETKLLAMTYSNMKPMDPQAHEDIATWVKNGGKLLYCGLDDDPFQSVSEWWNQNGNRYSAPSEHLFEKLGLQLCPETGFYKVGKGLVAVLRQNPKEFVISEHGDSTYLATVETLYGAELDYKNNFVLERGPYTIAAVMEESVSDEALTLKGHYIDLYNPELPVYEDYVLNPGCQRLLYNLSDIKVKKGQCKVLASASRISDEKMEEHRFSFRSAGTEETQGIARILVPSSPKSVFIDSCVNDFEYDVHSKTVLLKYPNSTMGKVIVMEF